MTKLEIVNSTPRHVKELCFSLRPGEKEEALGMGVEPNKAVYLSHRYATYRKTLLINGDVSAMWGLHGTLLGTKGVPYLLTNENIHRISPLKFARIYKQEVEIIKHLFPVLENYVDASYDGAVRMLQIAGFTLSEPIQMPSGKLFYKFSTQGYT